MRISIIGLLIAIAMNIKFSVANELELLWSIEDTFSMPESAAYDPKRKVIYVSNVNHYAKDNNGFISRVNEDGSELQLKWLTGLHSPTGLAVDNDILYAVDFDALVVIDLIEQKIVKRIDAEDATANPVLNDVTAGGNGDVYVTGSNSKSIYKLSDDKLQIWLHNAELLKHANGLLIEKNVLFHGGAVWTVFDTQTKKKVESYQSMGKGVIEVDGISKLSEDSFMVSLIDDSRLWLLRKGEPAIPFSDEEVNGIDMQFVAEKSVLFLPRVGNTLSAYRVSF